jgi:hypothetical protein
VQRTVHTGKVYGVSVLSSETRLVKTPNMVKALISGFHRASLLLVTFINQLMHPIDTAVDVKICVV